MTDDLRDEIDGWPVPTIYTRSYVRELESELRLVTAAVAELVAGLRIAANEFNAIRARDGAPQHIDWYRGRPMQTDSVTHEAWDEWTEMLLALVTKYGGDTVDLKKSDFPDG